MKKLLSLITLFVTIQAHGTHITGGQITTRCLGGLTQEVTLTLYADIQGIPVPNNTSVQCSSNNYNWTSTINMSHYGPYSINPTTNAYNYIDTITVPYSDYYTFSFTTCCRSLSIVNVNPPTYSTLYIETIVLIDTTCNSTPIVPVTPCPYVEVNTQDYHLINAYDLDGDSITYQLVSPLESVGSSLIGYLFPPSMSISNTGVLSIYSPIVGTYVICVKVSEFRNGNEIGHVLREFQITTTIQTGINEIKNINNFKNNDFYDMLGRKTRMDFDGIKIYQQ